MTASDAESGPGATNRLADSTSPYLLLHRSNPVDWYPWGPEALTRAREEGKPIFLSVGYSTCYWCHVMERESFSDPAVADFLNEHFVSVKVDREERPDLDEIYMTATQLLTQRGGWPNSVFLTPELEPFYAGTYFPPEDRHGLPGFPTVLRGIAQAWNSRRDEIRDQAARVAAAMRDYLSSPPEGPGGVPRSEAMEAAYEGLRRQYDAAWGGFGSAPKFPSPANLFLLLELDDRPDAREMLDGTLDAMARGGIYDQLGGGFHRYATDREWKIPHFEKMLYDNGLLLEVYAMAHERSPTLQRERVLRETVELVARELTGPEGGLWSAIDAETEGHEGAFYVWTGDELRGRLGAEDAAFLAPLLGFDGPPFFEGTHYVLHLPRPMEEQARARRIAPDALWEEIDPMRRTLFEARARRDRPLTDDKILADWNGLAIAGLSRAGRALEDEAILERGRRAARFVLEHHGGAAERPLRHVWREGEARVDAFLADYAYLVRGLLALHEATGEAEWLDAAVALTEEQIERLETPEGGFFAVGAAEDLLLRSRDVYDDALPNANGVAVLNLVRLLEVTGEDRWRETARRALAALGPAAERQPMAARTLVLASHRFRRATSAAPSSDGVVRHRLEVESAGEEDRGWRPFALELTVEDGWHVNANPASDERLVPTELDAAEGAVRSIAYPEGAFYRGTVRITGELRAPDTRALRLRFQACDDRRCLEPVIREIEVG